MSLTTIERVLVLRGADIFGAVAGEDLVPVARVAEEVRFGPGETFIREGDLADCLYVVVEGEIAVSLDEVGEISRTGPGSTIGEMAIVSRIRSANCAAIGDVLALRIGYDAFWELLAEQPPLALGLIKTLVERLAGTLGSLAGFTQGATTTASSRR